MDIRKIFALARYQNIKKKEGSGKVTNDDSDKVDDVEYAEYRGNFISRTLIVIFRIIIRFYQFTLSMILGRSCRFIPSCSYYMDESLVRFGLLKGLSKGLARVSRCHNIKIGDKNSQDNDDWYDPVIK